MSSIGRSVALSSLANFGNLAISLALVVVVSRLLPPEVVGAYVLAFAVILVIEPFRNLQLSSYIVLQPTVDARSLAPVYGFSLVTSLLAVIAALAAGVILHATYDDPAVGNGVFIMAGGLLMRAWSKPAVAILQRERRYGGLAFVLLGAAVAKSIVTIALVLRGWGAEALAIGSLVEFSIELAACAMIGTNRVAVLPRMRGMGEVSRFCFRFGGAQLAGQVSAALDGLLIGAFQGLAATAVFNRGSKLVRTFRSGLEQAVLPIALSGFSTLRDDRARLRGAYLGAVGSLTGVTWPALAATIVLAQPLILGLFGPAWAEAIYLTQVLAVGAIIHAASALSQQVHASVGEEALVLKREMALSFLRIAILVVTAQISMIAVAYGFVAMLAISFVVNQLLLARSLSITMADFARATGKSAIAALVTAALTAMALAARPPAMSDEWALVLFGSIAAGIWLITLVLVRHPIVGELIRTIRGRPA